MSSDVEERRGRERSREVVVVEGISKEIMRLRDELNNRFTAIKKILRKSLMSEQDWIRIDDYLTSVINCMETIVMYVCRTTSVKSTSTIFEILTEDFKEYNTLLSEVRSAIYHRDKFKLVNLLPKFEAKIRDLILKVTTAFVTKERVVIPTKGMFYTEEVVVPELSPSARKLYAILLNRVDIPIRDVYIMFGERASDVIAELKAHELAEDYTDPITLEHRLRLKR